MKMIGRLAACALLICTALASEDKEKPAPAAVPGAPVPYNFSDLINKAERIVLGEIGEKKDGVYTVKALETLKAPPRDTTQISPDAYKRAEELLNSGKSDVPPASKPTTAIENTNIGVIPINEKILPPPGTQVIFFLWEVEPKQEGKMPAYKISHPQCIYDSKVLPQVRAGLLAPRSISDGRYLRDWDERAAARLAAHKEEEELKKASGGEPVLGLQLEIVRPKLMIRGDNSFQIATHLNNNFTKEIMVYDGPASSYGIIIRKKDAPPESALVIRLNKFEEVDPVSLNITNLTDFEGVPGNNTLTREHLVDAKKIPALKTLAGEYTLKMFYINTKNGIKDGLNVPAWTGKMVSKEIPFTFKKVE